MLDPQDQRENQERKAGWVCLVLQDASSLDPRVILVQMALLVQLGRLAMDFLVLRVTEEIEALQAHLVPKETAILAPWVLLGCLDFQENLGRREWAFLDRRAILDFEGCLVYQDLQVKASQDLWVTLGDLVHLGQQVLKGKEFKGQRVNRGPRVW